MDDCRHGRPTAFPQASGQGQRGSLIGREPAYREGLPERQRHLPVVGVAGGRYDVRVSSPGLGAEFDALVSGFNQMASRLGSVEGTRRRLLADLGHEMRTPVATLEAGLEALEDGVATLDAPTAALLRAQTRRLTRLSDDISTVSQAEKGQVRLDRRPVQPRSVVTAAADAAAEAYQTEGVRLVTEIATGLPALSL